MKRLLFALALASVWQAANTVSADPLKADARARFQRGVEFYFEGSLDAALAEFSKAYELAPDYKILYNLAQVQFQRYDYVAALQLYDDYLEQGGGEVAASRREQVQESLHQLRGRIALLVVNSAAGAELRIDGRLVGALPLATPVRINPGVHDLSLRKEGFETLRHTLTIATGETVRLELPMAAPPIALLPKRLPAPPILPTPHQVTPPRAQAEPSRAPMWISLIATAALAGGAVTFGVLAQKADNQLGDMLTVVPADRRALDRTRSRIELNAGLCDGLTVGAAIGAVLSAYFALSGSETSRAGPRDGLAVGGYGLELAQRY